MDDYFGEILSKYKRAISDFALEASDFIENYVYSIEKTFRSEDSEIIYSTIPGVEKEICIKISYKKKGDLFEGNIKLNNKYFATGWEMNSKYAPGVYLGFAEVLFKNKYMIKLGKLVTSPSELMLNQDREYALIMKNIPGLFRLDFWFRDWKLDSIQGINFLAINISNIHKGYTNSVPREFGTEKQLLSKLELNIKMFHKALGKIREGRVFDIYQYEAIGELVKAYFISKRSLFKDRYKKGNIKHCHGDMKRKNIFILPAERLCPGRENVPEQFLLIDCIDFNPNLYYIDTLSDVAMLAVDLGLHFSDYTKEDNILKINPGYGYSLAFLVKYLEEYGENIDEALPIISYYMIEKLIVNFYVSVLYNNDNIMVNKYLDSILFHALRLERNDNAFKVVEKAFKLNLWSN